MGQRNMTYVITEDKYGNKDIRMIYNQWNYISVQLPKLIRAVKFILNPKCSCQHNAFQTFFAAHGLSPESGWVGGFDDTGGFNGKEDFNYTGPYQEDNNNGWNIVKITHKTDTLDDEQNVSIELCHLLGSEDTWVDGEQKYAPQQVFNTTDYFMLQPPYKADAKDLRKYKREVEWLASNTKFNPGIQKEAEVLIAEMIRKRK